MATEINNNGNSLKIVTDQVPLLVLKSEIKDVNVLRDTILKIDIGQGALNNIFVDQLDVTLPVSTSVDDLRDQVLAMLQTSTTGLATEQKQIDEINKINDLKTQVQDLQTKVGSVDNKLFFQPNITDQNNPNFIYKGYALPGSKTSDAVWAIEKVSSKKGIVASQWAAGNKSFDKIWDNRSKLIFS